MSSCCPTAEPVGGRPPEDFPPGSPASTLTEVFDSLSHPSSELEIHRTFASLPMQHTFLGEAFLLTVGAFLLTVKLLCLQSLKALTRRTFPL